MREHLHIMGIAGSGASAFARLAEASGYKVSGCDLTLEGHNPSHLTGVDTLIISPAILSLEPQNREILKAKRKKIKVVTWQEFLGKHLMAGKEVIGVCGTHGKSTIAAMAAYILEGAGFDPAYLLGAKIKGAESFGVGKDDYFIVEADEYNDNFLHYPITTSVCVALEFDHPEYFSDFDTYLDSFEQFVRRGKLLICYEGDPGVKVLLERLRGWKGRIVRFREPYRGQLLLPGVYNRINAQSAYLTAKVLGISGGEITRLLASFPGVERRLELKKIVGETKIYSDYGHHPTQLRATLGALREFYPGEQIIAVFQPHMFSRTKALFKDFVKVLREEMADQVILADIFPSREKDPGEIHSRDLVEAVNTDHLRYLPRNKIIPYLRARLVGVVVFIGAGDINRLVDEYEG